MSDNTKFYTQESIRKYSKIFKRPDGHWRMRWYGSRKQLENRNRRFLLGECNIDMRKTYSTHDLKPYPSQPDIDHVIYFDSMFDIFNILYTCGYTEHPSYLDIKSDIYKTYKHLKGQNDSFLASLNADRAYGLKPKRWKK